jgi:hypothetical protein
MHNSLHFKEEYIPFRYKNNLSVVDILKQTKTIIQNSGEYQNYMTKYKSKFKEPFKYPSTNELKLHALSSERNLCRSISPIRRTVNYFNSSTTTISKLHLPSGGNFTKTYDNLINNSSVLNCGENPINIFDIQADIFNEDGFSDKVYNISEIYRKDDYYNEMIKRKLEYFKNEKNQNFTTSLEKTFNKPKHTLFNIEGQTSVALISLEIRFINSSDLKSKPISFFLPLALLPIYYYVDIETFKLFLMAVLRFNDTFTDFTLNDEVIYTILNSWEEYETDKETIPIHSHNIYKFNWLTSKCIYDVYIR